MAVVVCDDEIGNLLEPELRGDVVHVDLFAVLAGARFEIEDGRLRDDASRGFHSERLCGRPFVSGYSCAGKCFEEALFR